MLTYKSPGVHIEDVLTEPARVLRTGVPVFLGLIQAESLKTLVAHDFHSVLKPIPHHEGVCIVRNKRFLSLPPRTFSAAADTGLSTRSPDPNTYLKAPARSSDLVTHERMPVEAAVQETEAESPLSLVELQAISEKPQRFTVWEQFEKTYGELRPFGFLVNAVRGFFENGGSLCYVQVIGYEPPGTLASALDAGMEILARYDDYDLVCAPDIWWPGHAAAPGVMDGIDLQRALLQHCDQLADRMAILDSLPGATSETVRDQRRRMDGANGALYYPWVRVQDGPSQTGGYVPPCGHVAGVVARCDQRVGVHKAPANEILEGVVNLETVLTDDQQGELNSESINCLRAFPRRGIRVWGARTLSSRPSGRYIGERRVLLTAVRWIERNLTDIVFEPHTPRLWDRIVRDLTAYFEDLGRSGALSAPPEGPAFYVKCDAETNPQDIREEGRVITEIGLRPTAAAEFILVRILHGPTGVQIEEAA